MAISGNILGAGGYALPQDSPENQQVELATIVSEEQVNPIGSVLGQAVFLATILSEESFGNLQVITGRTVELDTIPSEEIVNPIEGKTVRRDIFLGTIPSEEFVGPLNTAIVMHVVTIPSEEQVNPIAGNQQQIFLATIPSEEVVNPIANIIRSIQLATIPSEEVVNPLTALRFNKVELGTISSEERVSPIGALQSKIVYLNTIPSAEQVNPISPRFFVKVFLNTILSQEQVNPIGVRLVSCNDKGGMLKSITSAAVRSNQFAFCMLSRKSGYQTEIFYPMSGKYDQYTEEGSVYNRADHKFRYGCVPTLSCVVMVFSNFMTLDRVDGDEFFDNIGLEPSYAFTENRYIPVNSIVELIFHGKLLRFFISKITPLISVRERHGEGVRILTLQAHN